MYNMNMKIDEVKVSDGVKKIFKQLWGTLELEQVQIITQQETAMNNFDGYHEPVHNTQARAWRIALAFVGYPPKFTTEAEADKVSELVALCNMTELPMTGEQADIMRWQDETEATRRSDYPI